MANTAGSGSGIAGGEQCGAECSPHCSPCVSLMLCIVGQEVNELWAGLGYYSRGKRLQEAARKVLKAFPKFSVSCGWLLVHTCSASLELSWLHRAVEAGHPFYHMYRLCLLG